MRRAFLLLLPASVCFSLPVTLEGAEGALDGLVYVSPSSGSEWQSTESCLILRFAEQAPRSVDVDATGTISGEIPLEEYRSPQDLHVVVFTPGRPLAFGETVTVTARTAGSGPFSWSFDVRPFDPAVPAVEAPDAPPCEGIPDPVIDELMNPLPPVTTGGGTRAVAVPSDFPQLVVTQLGPQAPGYLFFSPIYPIGGNPSSYMMITDGTGQVLFYRHAHEAIMNVEVQPDGCLSYSTGGVGESVVWVEMDDTYTAVDEYEVVGYPTDVHDFSVSQDDEVLLMGDDWRQIDMSGVVPGGQPDALVMGLVIQVQDRNHMPVFQWNSFDYFEITDACSFVDLTGSTVDYVHCNSLDEDADGDLLISCLAMCECTRIDRQTGDIVWRFGGLMSENPDFTLVNDPLNGFSVQHDFRHSTGNRYTVFDNGRFHSPQVSRGLEYELDLQAMTATLVWSFQVTGLYGSHMGSTLRLQNGGYIIGWGDVTGSTPRPDITEVGPGGSAVLRVRYMPIGLESYRALKYDWIGQAVIPYLVAEIVTGETAVTLTYNVFSDMEYASYDIYTGTNPQALSLLTNTAQNQIKVWNLPPGWNYFAVKALDLGGTPTGFSNVDSSYVTWTGIEDSAEPIPPLAVSVSPCPAEGDFTVGISTPAACLADISVFDIAGREIAGMDDVPCVEGFNGIALSADGIPDGAYAVLVETGSGPGVARLVIVR